jgi:hypothetical protein
MNAMRVYLSHAQEDRDFARDLASRLEGQGLDVWFAADETMPGENVALIVGEALEKSDAMIVLVSPAAARSEWVRNEITFAIGSPRYKDRLIPVVLQPTRGMPWVLQQLAQIQAGKDTERLGREIASRLARRHESDN